MKHYQNHIRENQVVIVYAILLFILALLFMLGNGYSFHTLLAGVDDWNRYARQGVDIANNGLLINSIDGVYDGPGGFLYNYFIAVHIFLFGEVLWPIQLSQVVLLCGSFVLLFRLFKELFNQQQKWIWGGALLILLSLDFLRTYTLQLFSENVGGFFFFLALYYWFRKKFEFYYAATAFFGIAVLFRPNLITLLPIYFLLSLSFRELDSWKKAFFQLVILVALWVVLPLRNYAVSGSFALLPAEGTSDSFYQLSRYGADYFLNKILFCFGYLTRLMPAYQLRPHWVIIWIGFAAYLFIALRKRIAFEFKQIAWIIAAFLLTNVIFVTVGSYGYRSMILLIPLVLPFALKGFFELLRLAKK